MRHLSHADFDDFQNASSRFAWEVCPEGSNESKFASDGPAIDPNWFMRACLFSTWKEVNGAWFGRVIFVPWSKRRAIRYTANLTERCDRCV